MRRNEELSRHHHKHASRVARLCRLLLDDAQEAQEVAQEVFLSPALKDAWADEWDEETLVDDGMEIGWSFTDG